MLADINEVDPTYVDTVLVTMGKWQKDVTLVIADMHTDDCAVWDAKHKAIDEATRVWEVMRSQSHQVCRCS